MRLHVAVVVALVASGCATSQEPVIFGASHTVGIAIGGGATETGGEFVVGYKGQQLAVLPVSAVQANAEHFIGAGSQGQFDSFSVFGQFSSEAEQKAGASAGVGKFFATGFAAQNLARGYSAKLGGEGRSGVKGCGRGTETEKKTEAQKQQEHRYQMEFAQAWMKHELDLANARAKSTPTGTTGPTAARMIFGQYDYLAVAFDGSAIDSGLKLTLGYKTRNAAIIPVIGRDAAGNLVPLRGVKANGNDVLSVLGRFKNDNLGGVAESKVTIKSGLESFFTTGAAAQILSEGFQVQLCEEYSVKTN